MYREHQAQLLVGIAADRHWVLDLAGDLEVNRNLSLFAKLENLLDEVYAAAGGRPESDRDGRVRH